MPRVELVKQLIAAGIPQATAYRAAKINYQKGHDLGVMPDVINPGTLAPQGETGLSSRVNEDDSRALADFE